jgi:hypothetical protein
VYASAASMATADSRSVDRGRWSTESGQGTIRSLVGVRRSISSSRRKRSRPPTRRRAARSSPEYPAGPVARRFRSPRSTLTAAGHAVGCECRKLGQCRGAVSCFRWACSSGVGDRPIDRRRCRRRPRASQVRRPPHS